MDSAGFSWTLITIVGPLVLLLVIAWAVLRNRRSGAEEVDCDEATRRVYEEEDREHRHESDNVP
jgi:hypothetical protein